MIKVVRNYGDGVKTELLLKDAKTPKELQTFRDIVLAEIEATCGMSSYGASARLDELLREAEEEAAIEQKEQKDEPEQPSVEAEKESPKPEREPTAEELDALEFRTALAPKKYEGMNDSGKMFDDTKGAYKYSAYVKCDHCSGKVKTHVFLNETFVRCKGCGKTHPIAPYVPNAEYPDVYGNYFVKPMYTRQAKHEFEERKRAEAAQPVAPIFTTQGANEETAMGAALKAALFKQS